MDRQMRESLDRYLTTQPEEPEHEGCGCSRVPTDCCEEAWECETSVLLDANGDPDVRVCKRGFGCDTEAAMWERFNRAQHAAMARAEAEDRMAAAEAADMEWRIARYLDGEDD